MLRKNDGFTLVELLIVMALLVIILAIAADAFKTVARNATTQARIAETQMETSIGLQMLKADIESAGQGLPWAFAQTVNYTEAASGQPSIYNDAAAGVPRALVVGEGVGHNNSDYIAIKSTRGMSESSQRWGFVRKSLLGVTEVFNGTTADGSNLLNADFAIVVRPQTGENIYRQLLTNASGQFRYTVSGLSSLSLRPGDVIYGISSTSPGMPFNRTDYFVAQPDPMPAFCASGTGILYKATVNHSDGSLTQYPLLDCVVAMRVELGLDMNGNGIMDTIASGFSGTAAGGSVSNVATYTAYENYLAGASDVRTTLLSASLLRSRLKEVRVYVLAHEGRKDPNYSHQTNSIALGDSLAARGNIDLSAVVGDQWRHYRWKVYRAVIKTNNL